MAVILIAVGLLFTGIDFRIMTGLDYPAYVKASGEFLGVQMQEQIQNHVTDHILGTGLKADVLPDVVGCILIIAGAAMLVKHSKKYVSCMILAVITGILSVLLRVLPFFINSAALVMAVLPVYILLPVFEIWMEYRVIYVTVSISDDMVSQGTNRRMQFFWWITVFARVFIVLLTFSGLTGVCHIYEAAALVFTLLYLYLFLQTRTHIGSRKVYKEGFYAALLPDYIKEKIQGVSYVENDDVSLEELRYVSIRHYDFMGQVQHGELIVHHTIADRIMKIFYQLYQWEYPIDKVRLVDEYEGDDERSMEDNNSSAFNYRKVAGKEELSMHALGMAVDINPQINPYVREDGYFPKNAGEYLERDVKRCVGVHKDKMIHKDDPIYKIFKHNGFEWGGDWSHAKDYQHFVAKK